MIIANKGRYNKDVRKELSTLEELHMKLCDQKDFCFHTMLEEFKILVGTTYNFINPFIVRFDDNEEYTIKSIGFDYNECTYFDCIDKDGNECQIEPYNLNAYFDFEKMFDAVYEHLKSEQSILPNDEFALATVKYLEHECEWATENNISLEAFGKRMQAHTIDTNSELFDFSIGAFVFTISKVDEEYIVNSTYEIYDGNGKFIGTDQTFELKKRNLKKINGICK